LAGAVVVVAAAVVVSATLPGRLDSRDRSGFAALAAEQNGAAYWLGPRGSTSPVLVLSLTCPACLDRLAELEALDLAGRRRGPAIYLKVEKGKDDLAAAFVAAVQSRPGDRSEAFLAVGAYCLSQRDLLLSDPSGAARALLDTFPGATADIKEAEALLKAQALALAKAKVLSTPLLIAPGGTGRAFFNARDLFPVAR
jgi:hypothetical protein